MEIILNNITHYKNKLNKNYCLKDINLKFNEGNIIGIINYDLKLLYELFIAENRPTKGIIKIGDIVVGNDNSISNIKEIKKNVVYVGDYYRIFAESTVKDYFLGEDTFLANNKIENERLKKVLVMVLLHEDVLDRDPNTLSLGEKKRIILAKAILANPKVFIVDNFSYGLNCKEQDYFQKLFIKLRMKYNKTLIIDEKIEFLYNVIDRLVVLDKGSVVLDSDKKVFYNNELYKYVDMPKIVEFTKYVLSQDVNINSYMDLKELIKEIYRNLRYH